ncbi:MAG: homocysteine S-methyltransferase family protein [Firmicutes bacterium]|nr:homocysteine S-methyltransferase family protein [Bacillota bacterium]
MDKNAFRDFLGGRVVLLDGATGTELQKRNMPQGVCPEQWAADHPEVILEIQKLYVEAGSEVIYTCTFGGNRLKLSEFGMAESALALNQELASISKKAAGGKALVAGDLAPTGRMIEPLGDLPFEECVSVYKEQVSGLLAGGVDLFIIETMMDIQEARAALIAVKECCNLPVCVSMTFDRGQRTLTGTDPVTALITLQSLGADAVGCNCSTGPAEMAALLSLMKPYARVPLLAKPNAGLPKLIGGGAVFDMGVEEFCGWVESLVEAGASLLGGCCGTSPEYIRGVKAKIAGKKAAAVSYRPYCAITSIRKTVFFGAEFPVKVIGERINPTGKKKLQEELKQGLAQEVRRLAMEQTEKGAEILDVNVGMPGIDEKQTMVNITLLLSSFTEAPLCLDSSSPEVMEAALRIYPGRALINSISLEKAKIERLLPIAAKYGAMFVLLPVSDAGVPENSEKRREIVREVFAKAEEYGYRKEDVVVDGLVMAVSSNQQAGLETLAQIEWCSREFGSPSIIGLSNISFGLPERSWINAAFLAMAISRGLTLAIANPSGEMLMGLKMAADVLTVRDQDSLNYIAYFSGREKSASPDAPAPEPKSTRERIYQAVVRGEKEEIRSLIGQALAEGESPAEIADGIMIPAINEVGSLFDARKYFLPQLIRSAETMKAGFDQIEPLLAANQTGAGSDAAQVVLATVKGDIHDIGKNIVGLMLRNYGFKVHDLGKDVSAERIVAQAKETGAEIVGLSALMTTTMTEMKEVIQLARREGLTCKVMVGGAVVTEDYAREIGADGYARDAYEAVKLAQRLKTFSGKSSV